MTDEKPNNRKTGPGSRIKGAKQKGAAAFRAGKTSEDNPYSRPNMAKAWGAGFNDAASTDDTVTE